MKLWADLFDNLEIGMVLRDRRGRLRDMNRAAGEILGESLSLEESPSHEALTSGRIVRDRELSLPVGKGAGSCIRVTSVPVKNRFGKVKSVFSLLADITQQRESRDNLEENRELLQLVMDNIPQFVFWKDARSVYVGCNGNFARAAGLPRREDILGRTDYDLPWTRDEADAFLRDDREVMERGIPKYHIIEPQLQADGRQRWVETNKVPLKDGNGQVRGILGTYEDITERRELQAELERIKNSLSEIIDSMPSEIICVDRTCRVNLWNREAEIRNGLSQGNSIGSALGSVLKRMPGLEEEVREVLSKEQVFRKKSLTRKEGFQTVHEEITIYPLRENGGGTVGAVIRIDDITGAVKMQDQLLQSQKMDALGQLSGGIAHDFNNILGGIYGATELLLRDESLEDSNRKLLSIIKNSSERARDLIARLLTFSRSESEEFTPVDLHRVLEDTADILRTTLDKRITLHTRFESDGCMVLGKASHLQTVFLNLGINAGHAMEKGGELTIATSRVSLDDAFCRGSSFDLEEGEHILVRITDTGKGIPPEIIGRIFEPFFTTKEPGKGTGLGLSAAYGLMTKLRGAISVYSEEGVGTQFYLYLPLITPVPVPKEETEEVLPGGSARILLVDDEKEIVALTKSLLTGLGYKVLTAGDGVDALDIYRAAGEQIDLIIADMVMPRMNGTDLFFAVRALDPGQPFIISSGFSHEGEMKKLKDAGLNGFIQKPFRGVELSRLIHRVLGKETPSEPS